MGRRVLSLLAAVACLPAMLFVAQPAVAGLAAPTIAMSPVNARIDATTAPSFRYTTGGVPSDATVQIQRRLDSGTWSTVATGTPGTNKIVAGPVLWHMGQYVYRARAVEGSTVLVTTPNPHSVYAYSDITFAALCPATIGTRVCKTHKTTVGSTTLSTSIAIGSAAFPNYYAGAHLDRTSCRSLSAKFTSDSNATSKTYLKIYQPGQPDQVGTAAVAKVGTLSATLTGGQFYFDGSIQNHNTSVYFGGSASCWTANGSY